MGSRAALITLVTLAAIATAAWLPQLAQQVTVASPPTPASLLKKVRFRGARFEVVEVPLARFEVHVVWRPGGARLSEVGGAVRTNAGIFEPGFVPTGLLVSKGQELHRLNPRSGEGNFFLKPNGVFLVGHDGAAVVEASEYRGDGVREATQSGPLLVRRGAIHPQLAKDSRNLALRSGVGVRDSKTVVLAISRDEVNLWTFAALFRDALGCPDALYLDGVISALWAEGAGREAELGRGPFAGILTVEPRR